MSMKLRDLIKAVRACKTAAEERAVITHESALIRNGFKESTDASSRLRHRQVAKLMYIQLLGCPTHFGHMECIKLLAAPGFNDKRIGYLALSVLLDERAEVFTLITNSLQQDLAHPNQYVAALALNVLANIASAEMAHDLAPDVERHLKVSGPYLRKKAALCTIRLIKRAPALIESFLPRIVVLLTDKNHNVLLTAVTLITAVVEVQPAYVEKFTRLVPALVKILRKLLMATYAPEYDVGGVTDPFLQTKIIRLLRILGTGNAGASEAMNAVLAQVATNTEGPRNAGNAVLYEVVNAIMSVESESGLRVLAVNILGKFLASKDINLRYVALEALMKVVHVDPSAVQRHRAVVVDCLRDTDISIRKRALNLVCALVNHENVRALTPELLHFLAAADADTRPEVAIKIASVAEHYAPSKAWHIDTLLSLLHTAGNSVKRGVVSQALFLISHESEEQPALTHKLFSMLSAATVKNAPEAQQALLQVGAWCIGEYGNHLLSPPTGTGAASPSAHAGEQRSEADVVRTLERLLHLYYVSTETKAMILTTLLKLTARFKEAAVLERVRGLIKEYEGSPEIELQTRSVEFSAIAAPGVVPALDAYRVMLLDRIPLLDESVLRARQGGATGATSDAAALAGEDQIMEVQVRSSTAKPAVRPAAAAASLLDEFGLAAPSSLQAPAAAAGGGTSSLLGDLSDLLGPSPAPAPVPPAAKPAAPATGSKPASQLLDLDALFSSVATSAGDIVSDVTTELPLPRAPTTPAPAPAAAAPAVPSLDDLFGHTPAPRAAAPAPATLLGGGLPRMAPAPAPSHGVDALADLLGTSMSTAPAPAMASPVFGTPAASPVSAVPSGLSLPYVFVAYESANVRVSLRCEKPNGPSTAVTDIHATFTAVNKGISNFVCQVAPPKYLKLTLLPASGTSMGAHQSSAISQVIKVENSMQGSKSIMLKLKLVFTVDGSAEQVVESPELKSFPVTL